MSKSSRLVVSAILLVSIHGIGVFEAGAQESETAEEGEAIEAKVAEASHLIGLLDVGRAVKSHPQFLDSVAELKLEVEAAKENLEQKKGELKHLTEQLQIHPVGTDEHIMLEDQIAALKGELTHSVERQKKAFVRREAQIYYEAYQDIVEQSKQYARQNGIVMVFRFSADEPNANDPQSILKYINGPIVWHDERQDITDAVLKRLIEGWEKKGTAERKDGGEDAESSGEEPVPVAPEASDQ